MAPPRFAASEDTQRPASCSVGGMAKSSVHYVCTDCGWSGVQWFGRCPVCGAWGTIEEFREAPSRTKTRTSAATSRAAAIAASRGARPVHAVSSTGAPASARSGGTSTAARGSDAAHRGETGVSATPSVGPPPRPPPPWGLES
ncbi:hypothetical protein ACLUXB_07035, partial [Pseudoscardovia radai]